MNVYSKSSFTFLVPVYGGLRIALFKNILQFVDCVRRIASMNHGVTIRIDGPQIPFWVQAIAFTDCRRGYKVVDVNIPAANFAVHVLKTHKFFICVRFFRKLKVILSPP